MGVALSCVRCAGHVPKGREEKSDYIYAVRTHPTFLASSSSRSSSPRTCSPISTLTSTSTSPSTGFGTLFPTRNSMESEVQDHAGSNVAWQPTYASYPAPQHRTGHDTTQSISSIHVVKGLQRLPTELLLQISRYLPPSSVVSLHYACRQLYCTLGYRMRDFALEHPFAPYIVFDPSYQMVRGMERSKGAERLEFLLMLDRDGLIRRRPRVICDLCCSIHYNSCSSRTGCKRRKSKC